MIVVGGGMDDIFALNVDDITPWLDDPDRPVDELVGGLLKTPEAARDFLDRIRGGLASAARGELYTTDEVRAHLAARRRARRTAAE